MRISNSARFGGAIAIGAIVAVSAGSLLASPRFAWAKASQVAVVGRVETPLGLQGTRGAGRNVGIIFSLKDAARRKTDVEVQYGIDRNGDGNISDDEYRPATEDRLDSRDTRKNKKPQLFTTAGDIGAIQQFVWNSTQDIQSARLLTSDLAVTPQGRLIPDPDNPGSFLFATGPGGSPVLSGVKVRVRAFRSALDPVTKRPKNVYGDWAYTPDQFSLNNNDPPTMTIDAIDSNGISVPTASDEWVHIHWTAFDPNSEDLNGNGVLDVADNEDTNGNGVLDPENLGVAFDYHRVGPTENPATMTQAQIDGLTWLPCTRATKDAAGQTDSMIVGPGISPSGGLPSAPPGVGRQWVFSWDSVADVGTAYAKFIFRARPFDQKGEQGSFAYFRSTTSPFPLQSIQLDNWKVFNPGSAKFPIASLSSGRIGHTVTQLSPAANKDDPLDRGPDLGKNQFQAFLVAGGASSANGGGSNDLELMTLNTFAAETTTAARIPLTMTAARAYHSATALDDGRVLLIGGFDATGTNVLATTEIYDPKTRAISAGPSLAAGRARHTAVRLSSGDVAVFGGVGAANATLASCELINVRPAVDKVGDPIDTASWTVSALPNMATAQHSLSAVLLPDQTVLVTGGVDASGNGVTAAQILNPLNDDDPATPFTKDPIFTAVGPMGSARKFGTATPLLDGNVLFAGGVAGSSTLDTMEIYNWAADVQKFEAVTTKLQFAHAQHTATLLGDGSILIAGGTTDFNAATPPLTGDADVVKIGTRTVVSNVGSWSATLAVVNGDLSDARREAVAAAIDNGRAFVVGGKTSTGTTATMETFTPLNGSNLAPSARVILPAAEQAWLYGAPIYYRLTDPELDRARTVLQYIDRTPTGAGVWRACSPQPDTIGGDLAELTAGLATTLTDDTILAIDPVIHNTVGDHSYIWAMARDIPRPPLGGTAGPYNVRVLPYGAVRGTVSESSPITVLYNTKILPTILPFENIAANRPDDGRTTNGGVPTNNLPAGTLTPYQGGDIRIWVHLRDLDGGALHTNGDPASCLFEYAVDKNSDGQIKSDDGEGFLKCSASGAAVGFPSSANPQTGLQTYFDPHDASDPAFGLRPASKGWAHFDWDSIADIGAPATTFTNVWIRVTPSDANGGFQRLVRNVTGQPAVLTIVRHPDSVWLESWKPRFSNNKLASPINDPIDITFNGLIEPMSVDSTTLPFYRGTTTTSLVNGKYTVVNNATGSVVNNLAPNHSLVTFFPDPGSLSAGAITPGQSAANTVFYANDTYSFRVPGYVAGQVPTTGTTVRPLGQTVGGGQYSTYRLVQAVPINTSGADASYRLTTANVGVYANDLQPISNNSQSPLAGTTVLRNVGMTGSPQAVSFTFTQAIDPNTAISPNLSVTIPTNTTGGTRTTTSVIPGRWTVTNAQSVVGNGVNSTSVLTFVPVFQMPPSATVQFGWNSGLRAFNGTSLPTQSFAYTVESYTRVTNTGVVLESFTNQNQRDATATTALWGTEGCAPGALSGSSSGISTGTSPSGGVALTVAANATTTLTLATNNYSTINVAKNGTLVLDSQSGPMTILATGDITIAGTVTFKGKAGFNGMHGNTTYVYVYAGSSGSGGTRVGGAGRNGGGNGGDSVSVASGSTTYRNAGNNGGSGAGTTTTFGQGGQIPSETASSLNARYRYGAGGGAGGGNALAGLAGGRAMTQYTASAGYGAASTPGSAANDAFFSSGMTGGGGGGGGGSVCFIPTSYGYHEGGAGGAGAGAVTIYTNTAFNLTPTGLIDGRGGNGGAAAHSCGSGGGGAGGNLRIVALGGATMDGVVDLRGGQGGAHGFGQLDNQFYTNATTEKTARYGGNGSPGRLVVLAPNFTSPDEVRVYGQMMVRKVTTLPTFTVSATSPPFGLDGSTTTTSVNFGGLSEVHYTSLTVASGTTIDLINNTSGTLSNPVKIFVDGAINIAGTVRLNGDSTSPSSSSSPNGTTTQNFLGRSTYPYGFSYTNGTGSMYVSGSSFGGMYNYGYSTGMAGNMGGGKGGDGDNPLSTGIGALTAQPGSGPRPGVGNISTTTGYNYSGYWTMYTGDSGGSGGANATDGDDGWAVFAAPALYAYLGASSDTTGAGFAYQSGRPATSATFPKRAGTNTTDPSLAVTSNSTLTTYLTNFAGSGGGGGNPGADTYYQYYGLSGLGGGGAGAVAFVSPVSVTVTGTVMARGGDGNTPGAPYFWSPSYAHAGGGGGSGGTVYISSDTVTIGAVTPTTGTGGATFDMRGGFGGGYRSQNPGAGLQAYPEYMSVGSFGGNGGYGRLVIDYKTTLNSGRVLANRWGLEQTTIDSASNTYRAMAGTARFFCPGLSAGGSVGRSNWYDLRSISPILTSFTAGTVQNATLNLRIEGAQSLPNALGGAAGAYGAAYAANTGAPDPANTSGLFTPGTMTGWRFLRFDATFTRTTTSTGGAVVIDNMTATYTSDL